MRRAGVAWIAVGCAACAAATARAEDPGRLLARLEERARGFGNLHLRYELFLGRRETWPGRGWERGVWARWPEVWADRAADAGRLRLMLDRNHLWLEDPTSFRRAERGRFGPGLFSALWGAHPDRVPVSPVVWRALGPAHGREAEEIRGARRVARNGVDAWALDFDLARRTKELAVAEAASGRGDLGLPVEETLYLRANDLAPFCQETAYEGPRYRGTQLRMIDEVRAWRRLAGGVVPALVRITLQVWRRGRLDPLAGGRWELHLVEASQEGEAAGPPAFQRDLATDIGLAETAEIQARIAAAPRDPHDLWQLALARAEERRKARRATADRRRESEERLAAADARFFQACQEAVKAAPRAAGPVELLLEWHRSRGEREAALALAERALRGSIRLVHEVADLADDLAREGLESRARDLRELEIASRKRSDGTYDTASLLACWRSWHMDDQQLEILATLLTFPDPADLETTERALEALQGLKLERGSALALARGIESRLVGTRSPHPLAWLALAWAHTRAGQGPEAIRSLEAAQAAMGLGDLGGRVLATCYRQAIGLSEERQEWQAAYLAARRALADGRLGKERPDFLSAARAHLDHLRGDPQARVREELALLAAVPFEEAARRTPHDLPYRIGSVKEVAAAWAALPGPEGTLARFLLARAACQAQRDQEALEQTEALLGGPAAATRPVLLLALELAGRTTRRDPERAGRLLDRLARHFPEDPWVVYRRGLHAKTVEGQRGGRSLFERSARLLEALAARQETDPEVYHELRRALLAELFPEGDPERVRALFRAACHATDDSARRLELLLLAVPHAPRADLPLLFDIGGAVLRAQSRAGQEHWTVKGFALAARDRGGPEGVARWLAAVEEARAASPQGRRVQLFLAGDAAAALEQPEKVLRCWREAARLEGSPAVHELLAWRIDRGMEAGRAYELLETEIARLEREGVPGRTRAESLHALRCLLAKRVLARGDRARAEALAERLAVTPLPEARVRALDLAVRLAGLGENRQQLARLIELEADVLATAEPEVRDDECTGGSFRRYASRQMRLMARKRYEQCLALPGRSDADRERVRKKLGQLRKD